MCRFFDRIVASFRSQKIMIQKRKRTIQKSKRVFQEPELKRFREAKTYRFQNQNIWFRKQHLRFRNQISRFRNQICCILNNFTRKKYPATHSDQYLESWTLQEIIGPTTPPSAMLHVASWASQEIKPPSTPYDHYVACFGFLSRLLGLQICYCLSLGFRRILSVLSK